jgi:microcystin degradation protein MlrC
MRVGIVHLIHESNTFYPTTTGFDAFRQDHLLTGETIRTEFEGAFHEVGGFFKGLDEAGVEAVPIFSARTVPSGTITADAYEELLKILFAELAKAGPLDGLLLAPHGATVSEAYPDADGEWLARVRNEVGPGLPVVCTIDPHANLTPKMIAACDATIAYRTNPHLDQDQRGLEAARLLVRALKGEVRPVQAAAFPPIAINIERQLTSASPCRELYQKAAKIHDRPGVLSVSVVLGYPYSDVEEMGSSLIVVTDNDPDMAGSFVQELAATLWDHREDFVGQFLSIDEALDEAAAVEGPVGLLDMGDNVGGGSSADGTLIAHAIHQRRLPDSFVSLYDPDAAKQAAEAGPGSRVFLRMGGHVDDRHGAPLELEVTVKSLHDGQFAVTENRHGGWSKVDMGLTAVVVTDPGQVVQLTTYRTTPFSERQLTSCGIDPSRMRLVVIKGVHAPVAAYDSLCERLIRVNTPGVTTADMLALPYKNRRKPLFPFERDAEFTLDLA